MNVSKNMHLEGYFQVFTFHHFLFIILRSDFLACVCARVWSALRNQGQVLWARARHPSPKGMAGCIFLSQILLQTYQQVISGPPSEAGGPRAAECSHPASVRLSSVGPGSVSAGSHRAPSVLTVISTLLKQKIFQNPFTCPWHHCLSLLTLASGVLALKMVLPGAAWLPVPCEGAAGTFRNRPGALLTEAMPGPLHPAQPWNSKILTGRSLFVLVILGVIRGQGKAAFRKEKKKNQQKSGF